MHFENVPFYTTNDIIKYINITYDTCRLVDHIDHCPLECGLFRPEIFFDLGFSDLRLLDPRLSCTRYMYGYVEICVPSDHAFSWYIL